MSLNKGEKDMKIIVCVKQVPDTAEVKIDPVKGTLIREGVPAIINPDDKAGLEVALRLKDKYDAHITVLCMGPMQADDAIKEALAMGADEAILLSDFKFAGADTLATSQALAGAMRQLDYDLIVTGRQAIDGDTAQVGPQVAELLDIPQISYVSQLEYKKGVFYAHRKVEDRTYLLKAEAPLLVTILAEEVTPRYMSVQGILGAYGEKKVEVWNASKILVEETKLGLKGSPTRVKESFAKSLKASGVVHEVDPQTGAKIIAEELAKRFFI